MGTTEFPTIPFTGQYVQSECLLYELADWTGRLTFCTIMITFRISINTHYIAMVVWIILNTWTSFKANTCETIPGRTVVRRTQSKYVMTM